MVEKHYCAFAFFGVIIFYLKEFNNLLHNGYVNAKILQISINASILKPYYLHIQVLVTLEVTPTREKRL
jgi:general stress protein CsbA